ncbi:MAG: quinon protein alcohol dehydrogenase-like superfamily [Benjaminiella poitrasii]|nr:MAG: quinon protein alcohol dehydrogenase-like superfamily [Benjaminiella poitrasii]
MSFDQNIYTENNTDENTEKETIDQDIINRSSTTIHHDLSQFKKGKKKLRLPEIDPNAPCYIHQLSVEVVAHIFARLDPVSLATVAKVCTYWRHIIMDDGCWRDAFVSYFGSLPFKRLSVESWKTEYILRIHLIRKWTKGRGTVMSFNPKIGSLESMQVDFEDSSMLVASAEHGVAAKCNPMTGKVAHRHLLYSTNENIRLQLSAVTMDKDRILWGFAPGYVTLSTRTKSTSRLKVFSDFHQSPVSVLALPQHVQDIVLSGAEDGTVNVWDAFTSSCAWTFYPSSATARAPTCLKATSDHRLLIGYDDGSMVIFNVNLNHIAQLNRTRNQEDFSKKRDAFQKQLDEEKVVINAPLASSDTIRTTVKSFTYDLETGHVIVAYGGVTNAYKYSADTGACLAVFGYGHTAGTSITCMKWDTAPISATLSLESAMKPRPAVGKRKGGSIIHLSSPNSSNNTTPTTGLSSGQSSPSAVNVKTTRVLVTGDDLGTICLWNGDEVSKEEGRAIRPIRVLSGHEVAISAIYIDACKLVTGSDDGWIRMWDPLTGININTLGNKIPKNAPVDRTDVNVMRVKNIWCNDYQGVATIGHQVKTWDFSPGKQFLSRRALKQKGKPYNAVLRDRFRYEIDREVKDSIAKMELDKREREREEREIHKLSLGGLTDEEMLHYALMLSQQESASTTSPAQPTPQINGDYVDDEDEELMKAVIASLELENRSFIDPNMLNGDSSSSGNGNSNSNSSSSSSSSSSNSNQISSNSSAIDVTRSFEDNSNQLDEVWPTVAETASTENRSIEDEDMDEELRYILELSKTDK